MMENPFVDKESGIEGQLAIERMNLDRNSEEVLRLIGEKDPATMTAKAKLLLAKISNIVSDKTFLIGVGGVAVSGAMMAGAALQVPSLEYKTVLEALAIIGAITGQLGMMGTAKFGKIIEDLEAKMGKAKTA